MQRFVDASAIGWYNYLYGDNAKANALIKKDNPDMTDEQIAFSIAKIKEYGLADSGDTKKLGIGAMTDARIKNFFHSTVKAAASRTMSTTKRPTLCNLSTRASASICARSKSGALRVREAVPGARRRVAPAVRRNRLTMSAKFRFPKRGATR